MKIAGLVLGILGILCALFGFIGGTLGLILSIVGLVLASMGNKKYGKDGLGTAALVLSIIAVCLTGITFISCGIMLALAGSVAA